jgi:hypothetical protein
VVCLNSMGQDKEFTEEERKIALRTVRTFKDQWEELERVNLENDVRLRIYNRSTDKAYKMTNEDLDHQAMEKKVDESVAVKEGDEPLDDDAKYLMKKNTQLKLYVRGFYVAPEDKEKPKVKSTRASKASEAAEEKKAAAAEARASAN